MKFIKLKKTYIFGGFLENSMLPDISISVFRNVFMIGLKVIFFNNNTILLKGNYSAIFLH